MIHYNTNPEFSLGIWTSYKPGGNLGASTINWVLVDDKILTFSSPILTYRGFVCKLMPSIVILTPPLYSI